MTPLDAVLQPLGYAFFLRALVASTVVGLVCAVVGSYMVLRGLAFMGDALSHSAFPGVVAAYLLKGPFYLGAAIAAVGTALAIGWDTRPRRRVTLASRMNVVISRNSQVDRVFRIAGISRALPVYFDREVALTALAVIVLAVVAVIWKELLYSTFDPLGAAAAGLPVARLDYVLLAVIALTIVVSLQAVGIILVVAMLVTPAAIGQLLATSFGRLVAIAIAVGVVSPIAGLYLSYWLDAATGATIVLVETGLFILALALVSVRRRVPAKA